MSAISFHDVRLEVVRPGKPHNQLLSPLTPYMALCGEGSPVTFHIGFEHHQLMTRLERLRYVTPGAGGMVAVPDRMREAELAQLGEDIARILTDIPTLSTALARAQGTHQNDSSDSAGNLVHLRLVLSGSELSLIPFELAIAPQGYPGEGVEFCLQSSLPVVLTREVHRDRPRLASWGQQGKPKILFVWAEPAGLKVPAKDHVDRLRAAVEPWTRRVAPSAEGAGAKEGETKPPASEEARLPFVKERLRLLPNASVEQIYRMCAEERFTHIHILAHGDTYNEGGVDRFGVALCRDGDPQRKEVVSGKRLAKALLAEDEDGVGRRSRPLVVTMATCDAGNQSQVLAPGGSIAHELHGEGIPWVFASQFPLTKSGSVRMVEIIYKRLLRGDDPRQMSFELRRELYRSGANDHDWASMVTYSSVPANFEEEVADYAWGQTKAAIEVSLRYADELTMDGTRAESSAAGEAGRVMAEVRELLSVSKARMPPPDSARNRWRRAEIIGMQGSTLKRIALLMAKVGDRNVAAIYDEALDSYRRAMEEAVSATDKYYWTATQYLSLCAVRNGPKDPDSYELARRLALRDTESMRDKDTRAWAHGTVAELELLGPYHARRKWKGVEEEVVEHCRAIVELMGPESFHVGSTRRQFRRYLDYWDDPKNPQRRAVAAAAVETLEKADRPESDS